jgi:peptide chain release factor 2
LEDILILNDETFREMVEQEILELDVTLEEKIFQQMLSGQYDEVDAILAIHAGAGGTDSQDWADMLQRMFLRWAGNKKYQVEILDMTPGEEAGIKSVTLSIQGKYAYGYLRSERGVHRLVRLSPFDAAHRRHTSFALVEVLPKIDNNDDEGLLDMNAIRLTHIPSGIVVTCQNERSQGQNREVALSVLRSRLLQIRLAKKEAEIAVLKGDYTKAEWGSQIRSYVLHPYQMVKDHRTNFEVGSAENVLDGQLDKFMEEYLKQGESEKN